VVVAAISSVVGDMELVVDVVVIVEKLKCRAQENINTYCWGICDVFEDDDDDDMESSFRLGI
jgi:hypothetical protein